MQGYILLHRKLFENEIYFEEKFDKAHAWIDLLLLANYMDRIVSIKGAEIQLKAGQLCLSKVSLAKRWGWDRRTVKKYLDVLQDVHMIVQQNIGLTTIITIVNWNKYQSLVQGSDTGKYSCERLTMLTDNKINNIKEKKGEAKDEVLNIKENKQPVKNTLNINSYLRTFRKVSK